MVEKCEWGGMLCQLSQWMLLGVCVEILGAVWTVLFWSPAFGCLAGLRGFMGLQGRSEVYRPGPLSTKAGPSLASRRRFHSRGTGWGWQGASEWAQACCCGASLTQECLSLADEHNVHATLKAWHPLHGTAPYCSSLALPSCSQAPLFCLLFSPFDLLGELAEGAASCCKDDLPHPTPEPGCSLQGGRLGKISAGSLPPP